MLTTVPTGIAEIGRYGLGIYETKLPNGVSIWGHAGASRGFLLLLEAHLEASIH